MMTGFLRRFICLLLSLLVFGVAQVPLVNGKECSYKSSSFECPNCGGIQVADCAKCEGYLFPDYQRGICFHRKLFNAKNHQKDDPDNHYPFLWNDIAAAILCFFTAGVATACGVGGGGIYVPIGIILLRFTPKASSGLSQASIFGASLGGLLVNIRARHPNTHTIAATSGLQSVFTRPIIDYDMALFLAPMEMAGAGLGVIIQKLFPNWLFLFVATLILGITSFKTYSKFFATYHKEKSMHTDDKNQQLIQSKKLEMSKVECQYTLQMDESRDDAVVSDFGGSEEKPVHELLHRNRGENPPHSHTNNVVVEELHDCEKFLADDSRQYPIEKLSYLALLWVGLTVIIFLKGGNGVDSLVGITCKDPSFYALIACQFIWTFGFAAFFGHRCVKRTEDRLAANYPFNESDVLWDFKKVRFYSFFTFVAGIIAGLVGIGGGMVLGPLMLVMGIHPSVSTATTATMIVLTSSCVAFMFVMFGLVPWEYAIFFFSVCFFGALIGKTKIDSHVKKTGMTCVIIGNLATIIGLAAVGCLTILFINLSSSGWCLDGFKEFCNISGSANGCHGRILETLDMFQE